MAQQPESPQPELLLTHALDEMQSEMRFLLNWAFPVVPNDPPVDEENNNDA